MLRRICDIAWTPERSAGLTRQLPQHCATDPSRDGDDESDHEKGEDEPRAHGVLPLQLHESSAAQGKHALWAYDSGLVTLTITRLYALAHMTTIESAP
jgi:hypothetical protein